MKKRQVKNRKEPKYGRKTKKISKHGNRLKSYKARGIVLKSMKLGEADKIVTIFTEEKGKIAAVAKGVRRTKSRFGARLEIFTNLNLVIHQGRNLDTIIQADIVEIYPKLTGDFDKINYGYAMLELVDKMTADRHAEPKIYQLLTTALGSLDLNLIDNDIILSTFDLKFLAVTGVLPNLSACSICGDKKKTIKLFSPEQGGMLCDGCAAGDQTVFEIEPDVLTLVKQLLYSPFSDLEGIEGGKSLNALDRLLESHLIYHFNLRLKARDFIGH